MYYLECRSSNIEFIDTDDWEYECEDCNTKFNTNRIRRG